MRRARSKQPQQSSYGGHGGYNALNGSGEREPGESAKNVKTALHADVSIRCRIQASCWWAHQDSNLEPKDSLTRMFPSGADYLITLSLRWWGAARSSLS